MPAVVLQSTPALRSFGPSSSSSSYTPSDPSGPMSVAEIKENARTAVQRIRGASAISMLRTARDQAVSGFEREAEGDLPGALRALLTAAELSKKVFESAEFKAESTGKKGVVWKDFVEFQQQYGNNLVPRANGIEAKMMEMGKYKPAEETKPGGSIADRMRALQDHGLAVGPTKRFPRETPSSSSSPPVSASPMSRSSSAQSPNHSGAASAPPTQTTFAVGSPLLASASSAPSAHNFVSVSTLGSSSPTSPTASVSSPRHSHLSISEFTHAFPSIDEIDESGPTSSRPSSIVSGPTSSHRNSGADTFLRLPELPSVPTTKPGSAAAAAASRAPLPSPSAIARFPSLPLDLDPGPRPASTPIPPTLSSLQSRPPSPAPARNPLSPTIPPKPAALSTGSSSPRQRTPTHTGERVELPVTNTIFPKMLAEYLNKRSISVLLLDVRTREEFVAGHIKNDAITCIDPYVLTRDGLTGEKLEDSLSVAPRKELMFFSNRDKFDLVVLYDNSSESFGASTSALSVAVRVIYENAFKRMLKKPPVLLVGGISAWCAAYPHEVVQEVENSGGGSSSGSSASASTITNGASSPMDADAAQERLERLKISTTGVNGINGSSGMNGHSAALESPHEIWTPTRSSYPMDQIPEDANDLNGAAGPSSSAPPHRLVRKPAMSRPPSTSSISFSPRGIYDNPPSSYQPTHSVSSSVSSISYPQFSRPSSTSSFGTSLTSASSHGTPVVSPPPQASLNPALSRRRSDYIDQSEQAVSSFASRPSIDYPDLSAQHVLRPPPVAATPPLERQDNRPRIPSHSHRQSFSMLPADVPRPPMINSEYPVSYWPDLQVATSGLKNLGNTCYMNSTIQCLSATVPFARFFTDGRWKSAVNMVNPLGTKGHLTQAFSSILYELWHEGLQSISPYSFRRSVCVYAKQFAGSDQHDTQEFLSFLLDGLHEDLNRILQKPALETTPEREAELERLPQHIASEQEWKIYRMRNDSIIVDYFQGQFRNRMECLTCHKTSTTYNSFMPLSLPIPTGRGLSKVTLQQCLEAFVHEEVMEKSDAWRCPNCKALRKATKRLSLSRLPPVLIIHLKRFSSKGPFTDKLETFVDFPLKNLDLTNYMPPPLPPNVERKSSSPINLEDPRTQIPPYRYELYAVTNHFGTLSSGHYTAFINSRGNWLYCDDSRISNADAKEVVGKPAYVLYYKRCKA